MRAPLLELGLFKTGTTAIADYFRCNGWATSHNVCKARGNETTCVRCMGRFLEEAASIVLQNSVFYFSFPGGVNRSTVEELAWCRVVSAPSRCGASGRRRYVGAAAF